MSYTDTLHRLGTASERAVLSVYAAFLDGSLSRADTVAYMAGLIARYNGRARSLADLAMAAELMAALGEPVPATGITMPAGEPARLAKAAGTVLVVAEESDVPQAIVARLARCEPLAAAADTYTDVMIRSGRTRGWTRHISSGACQLCRWWWRDGRVWPAEHPFQHHKGCTCSPKPVVTEGIRETWKTARATGLR